MKDPEEIEESLEEMETTRKTAIHAVMSFVFGLAILVVLTLVVVFLIKNKPEADRVETKALLPAVNVWMASSKVRQAKIVSQGVVESVQEVTLSAEVSGRIDRLPQLLLRGSKVEAGQVLVEIEPEDYLAELARANANLADAELALAQEIARQEQAERDWKKLGSGKRSALVRRIPQVKSAEARVDSALAEAARADRNVKRTKIAAPFAGTVRAEAVEIGAVLAPGSMVATIYSTEDLEVRLPLTLEDFGYLQRKEDGSVQGKVTLEGRIGTTRYEWPGEVVRIDGEVDRETMSATIIVKVGEADEAPDFLRRPPVGLFVEAVVPGRQLDSLAKIPRDALRRGNQVLVVGEGNLLSIRTVRISRADRSFVYVSEGVNDGEAVVLTRMSGAANDVEVQIDNRLGEGMMDQVEETP